MKARERLMTRVATAIVKGRWIILALFAAMIVFSCISLRWVHVETEVTAYLPEDAEARVGLSMMNEEFTTYGSSRVMVKDVDYEKAEALAQEIREVENVVLVSFDDSVSHYNNGHALFSVTFGDEPNAEASLRALDEIKALLADYEVVIHGDVGYSLASAVAKQMLNVSVFVVIVVLAVLVFTSSTYAEIPVMVLTFLVAAIVNLGTHFLLGTISFVSNSVAIVLQLALSVDYAIIFCNRYKEEHKTLDVRDAVTRALAASIPEISASSLTTIAGLTAMTFMKFRLGIDMGISLIKAIVCSLLTVFLFMPSLLLLFGKAMDKTKHRNFVPRIDFVGRFAYKTRFVLPILFVLLLVGGYTVFSHVDYAYDQYMVPALRMTERETARAEINSNFGSSNLVAVMVPKGDYAAEQSLIDDLSDCDEVKSATGLSSIEVMEGYRLGDMVNAKDIVQLTGVSETSAQALFAYYAAAHGDHRLVEEELDDYQAPLVDLFLFIHDAIESGAVELTEEQTAMIEPLYGQLVLLQGQLQGKNHSRILVDLDLPSQSDETFLFLERIHLLAANYYDDSDVCLTGDSVSAKGFKESFASDNRVVGLMSLALVMLILFFTFKSFGMPLLLILVIQGSIWLNFAVAKLQGNCVFFLCYLIVSAIQMGANIDYAIVVSSRYRELRESMELRESIIETMNLAFPTVITSGLMMVCAGLLIGFGVSQCIIAGMGYYVGTGTSISIVLILFALPQLLLLGDKFVSATTIQTDNSRLAGFLAKNSRRFAAGLLAAASLFVLVAAPLGKRDGEQYAEQTRNQAETLLEQTAELEALAEKLDAEQTMYAALKYQFAEQLMTDEVGTGLLEEGEAEYLAGLEKYEAGKEQYEEGAAQLADGKAQYEEGLEQYRAALAKYQAGKRRLEEGQAQYDASYAQYEEGKAAYAAGQQRLAEGQAQYDAGLATFEEGKAAYAAGEQKLAEGQAAYDAALAQYNEGKAQYDEARNTLSAVSALYNTVLPLYNNYLDLQGQYDEAVARGDVLSALILGASLAAARTAFETSLGGYTISELMQEYQDAEEQLNEAAARLAEAEAQLNAGKAELDAGYAELAAAQQQLDEAEAQLNAGRAELDAGYAELAAAEQQLADAEVQLAAGKKALDEGYAQLAEGEAQLAAGKAKLDAAKAQLDEGDAQLAEAKEQLDEGEKALDEAADELDSGRKTLTENREQLSNSLAALDDYTTDETKLTEGIRLLMENPAVKNRVGRTASTAEVLNAAEKVFRDELDSAEEQAAASRWISVVLIVTAALALLSVLLWVFKRGYLASALLALLSAAAALFCLLFWRTRCESLTRQVTVAAMLLIVFGVLFAQQLFRKHREEKTEAKA